MGGAVSSGRDNDELVDNLMSGNYIRTRAVERVFRALDRADYMSAEAREQAYKDLAWRNGPLHLSAPCIYSEVMEALDLKPGLSFLNIGSGTGYLSTLVGLIIGSAGISHGVEASAAVYEYANKKLSHFIENNVTVDEFDFCMPKYYTGNGLCLSPSHTYDRVYCGAGVVAKHEEYFKQLIKVNGVLVMPLAEQLVQLRRVSATQWKRRNLLNVSFAHLVEPAARDAHPLLTLEEQCPAPLQALCRAAIRASVRAGVQRRDQALCEPPPAAPRPRTGPRRICIPYDVTSDEELRELHDLDEADGAHEMNALLSLVLSMGQNRAAGSLRFDNDDERAHPEEESENERDERAPADDDYIVFDVGVRAAAVRRRPRAPRAPPAPPAPAPDQPASPPDSQDGQAASSSPPRDSAASTPPSDAPAAHRGESDGASVSVSASTRRAPRARAPPRPAPRSFWSDFSSSEDDSLQMKDNKRQKLDSGIGEGTASSGASPDKSDDKSDNKSGGKTSRSHSDTDDDDGDMPWEERGDYVSALSGDDSDSELDSEWEAAGAAVADVMMRKRATRRRARTAPGGRRRRGGSEPRRSRSGSGAEEGGARPHLADARRLRLSLAVRRALSDLPLPHALKMYVNYGRSLHD